MDDQFTRRSFFQKSFIGLVAIPFITSKLANAGESCPAAAPAGKVIAKPEEGMGKTLEYVVDAKTTKNAKYKTGSDCSNCKFYNAAKAEAGYAPCTMMGMKYVSNCGWCKGYMPK